MVLKRHGAGVIVSGRSAVKVAGRGDVARAYSMSGCFEGGRLDYPATALRHRARCRRGCLPGPGQGRGCLRPVRIAVPGAAAGAGFAGSSGSRR